MSIENQRRIVVQEATSWLWTPFHWYAKVKGPDGGCDCGSLLQACFERIGPIEMPRYTTQFFLHNDDEVYLKALARYCFVGGHKYSPAPRPEKCPTCQSTAASCSDSWHIWPCVACGIPEAGHINLRTPEPGDIVCFKMGKAFGHAGIVVQWPVMIHSCARDGQVSKVHADSHPELAGRDRLFFSWKAWHP